MSNGKGKREWKIVISPSAHRLYKRFDKRLQEKVKEEANKISKNPYAAPKLSAPYENVRSHHFSFRGSQYRIAYEVIEETNTIYIWLVKTREKFYEVLRRALGL